MKGVVKYFALALIFILAVLCLRPVSTLEKDSLHTMGKVESVWYDSKTQDLTLKLSGDKRYYYLNRAGNRGLDIPGLTKQLTGSQLSLSYADHWTPLDLFGSVKHITRLALGDSVLFSEY